MLHVKHSEYCLDQLEAHDSIFINLPPTLFFNEDNPFIEDTQSHMKSSVHCRNINSILLIEGIQSVLMPKFYE